MAIGFLLVVPSAAPASATPLIVKAPYIGSVQPTNQLSSSGCSSARLTSAVHFSMKTGSGGFAGQTAANRCRPLFGSMGSYSVATIGEDLELLFHVPARTGHHYILANVTFTVAGSERIVPGTCIANGTSQPICTQSASWEMTAKTVIVDSTNGSNFAAANSWAGLGSYSYNDSACTRGGCSNSSGGGSSGGFSGATSFVWNITVPGMTRGHVYVLYIDVFFGVAAECAGASTVLSSCTARAVLNAASLGNGLTVNSLTVG
ncbi:MAG TPA: hypothetical protein VFF67_01030 [Thermoplasmata archaeon]|nr:hypothetical protein [Thermoplasmata archaeon]